MQFILPASVSSRSRIHPIPDFLQNQSVVVSPEVEDLKLLSFWLMKSCAIFVQDLQIPGLLSRRVHEAHGVPASRVTNPDLSFCCQHTIHQLQQWIVVACFIQNVASDNQIKFSLNRMSPVHDKSLGGRGNR